VGDSLFIRKTVVSIFAVLFSAQIHAQVEISLEKLDPLVDKLMEAWDVPGAVVAVVNSDEIQFTKGYGVKQLGSEAPVDEHSLFG